MQIKKHWKAIGSVVQDILVDKHIFWDKLIVEIDGNVKEYDMNKYERMDLRQEEFYEIREGYKECYFLEVKDIFLEVNTSLSLAIVYFV